MCHCTFGRLPPDHKEEAYKIIISKCLPIAKRRVSTCHVALLNFATAGLLNHTTHTTSLPTRLIEKVPSLNGMAEALPVKAFATIYNLVELTHTGSHFAVWAFSLFATFL